MAKRYTITPATTAADLAAVRDLCWGYRQFLFENSPIDRLITETFYPVPKYSALMDDLENAHARPTGAILLARLADGTPVGCGMTHQIAPGTSEIKRVFVTDAARGSGIAAQICRDLMAQARDDGFAKMVLDTSIQLTAAQRLYEKLGFVRCAPYQPVPADVLKHLVFFEATL